MDKRQSGGQEQMTQCSICKTHFRGRPDFGICPDCNPFEPIEVHCICCDRNLFSGPFEVRNGACFCKEHAEQYDNGTLSEYHMENYINKT